MQRPPWRRMRHLAMEVGGATLLASVLGCAGGAPLLHPAQVEPAGTVIMGAGVAGQVAAGDLGTTLRSAQNVAVPGAAVTPQAPAAYASGVMAAAGVDPGVSPWVSGAVGLAGNNEGGLLFTARTLRADVRHAFEKGRWAFSVELGGHALLERPGYKSGALGGLDLGAVSGYGLDVPLLLGWEDRLHIVALWLGARGGYERVQGSVVVSGLPFMGGETMSTTPIAADHWSAGGLLGLRVGFNHVFVATELDASYEHVTGKLGTLSASASGLGLTPAAALLLRF